jgi:hypothetical protein
VLARDRIQPVAAGHAGPVQDLAENSRRGQAREPCEVDGRLGVPRPSQHPPFLGHERKQVPRPLQVIRFGRGVDDGPHRSRPLFGADARVARPVVDRHRVGRFVSRRIAVHHGPQMESRGNFGQDRHAHQPPPVGDHELNHLGSDHLGRGNKVTFVLAVFVVDDDDDPPCSQGLECLVDLGKLFVHRFALSFPG